MTDSDTIQNDFCLPMGEVRSRLESEIEHSVRRLLDEADQALEIAEIGNILKAYLDLPGKRLRPLLLILSLRALDPKHPIDDGILRMAAGLEFFHEFLLIHDDLIDSSNTRRGAPTLWRRLQDSAELSPEHARSVALILGDLLYAQAVDNIAAHPGPAATTNRALRYLMGVAKHTGWGAIAEIRFSEIGIRAITADAIESVYQAKTTCYTFEAPMILAAIQVHVSESTQKTLAAVARPLGKAFQLENDLHELIAWGRNPDSVSADLKGHIKTLPMVRLHQALDADGQDRLSAVLVTPNLSAHRDAFAEMMIGSGLVGLVRNEINRLFDEPDRILKTSSLPEQTLNGLNAMVDTIRSNRNHSEA